jgi:hypothetical protein
MTSRRSLDHGVGRSDAILATPRRRDRRPADSVDALFINWRPAQGWEQILIVRARQAERRAALGQLAGLL